MRGKDHADDNAQQKQRNVYGRTIGRRRMFIIHFNTSFHELRRLFATVSSNHVSIYCGWTATGSRGRPRARAGPAACERKSLTPL